MHFTCFDLVLEGVLAVHQQLVQVERLLGDGEVDHLLELLGVVEVEYLGGPVVLDGDVVQQDLHHLHQSEVSLWSRDPLSTNHSSPGAGTPASWRPSPPSCRSGTPATTLQKNISLFHSKISCFLFYSKSFYCSIRKYLFSRMHIYRNIMQMAIMMRLGSGV